MTSRTIRDLVARSIACALLAFGVAAGPVLADGGSSGPVSVPPFTALAAGGLHACALTADGAVWCWAYGAYGQLGNGSIAAAYDAPVEVHGLPPVASISAGGNSTCALDRSGKVWCWGENGRGQLGVGTTLGSATPVQVHGLGLAATAISVGYDHACAILSDASAMCWGANASGQLGDGTEIERLVPAPVTAIASSGGPIATISAGNLHTCATTADGTAWCWGSNLRGELGDGTTTGSLPGVRVAGIGGTARQVVAGDTWTCALRTDGVVLCWGENTVTTTTGSVAGALGTGSSAATVAAPAPVPGLPAGIASIATHSWTLPRVAALAGDGSAWTWGANVDSAVGPGSAAVVQASAIRATGDVTALAAGGTFTVVLLPNGEVRWWGIGDPTPRLPWAVTAARFEYRPPGTLVPAITTSIPTPSQISTDPAVLGANLLLAAIAMLAFTGASELLNRTVADLEPVVRRRLRPAWTLAATRRRIDARLAAALGHDRRGDALRVLAVAAFYGIVYALLDPSWNPLSVTGLWLVVCFAVACGLVGMSDDYALWATARRYGVASDLKVRPGSLVTALASTVATRLFVLIPGVMIGQPEALDVEEERLDRPQKGRLAASGLGAIGIIGGGAWLLTVATTALGDAVPAIAVPVAGLQAFLLLVFAVALQNGFVQLLAFGNSAGRALYHVSRLWWGIALLAVTFLFWETLVNPRGNLAEALESTNVRAFLATVSIVLGLALAGWLVARVIRRREGAARAGNEAELADQPLEAVDAAPEPAEEPPPAPNEAPEPADAPIDAPAPRRRRRRASPRSSPPADT